MIRIHPDKDDRILNITTCFGIFLTLILKPWFDLVLTPIHPDQYIDNADPFPKCENAPCGFATRVSKPKFVLKYMLTCLRLVVTPDMVRETRWFRSPYVGVVSFRVLNK